MLGYPADLSLRGDIIGMIHPEDRDTARSELFRLTSGKTQQRPLTIRVHDSRAHWRHFEVLAVNWKDDAETATQFFGSRDLVLPLLLDRGGDVYSQYKLQGLPDSFFIDREGILSGTYFGAPTEAKMRERLAAAGLP